MDSSTPKMTTVAASEDTRDELKLIRDEFGDDTLPETLSNLVKYYRVTSSQFSVADVITDSTDLEKVIVLRVGDERVSSLGNIEVLRQIEQ